MARPLRLEFAGALYHVTSRGDGREDIFRAVGDRSVFFDVLAGVRGRFNWIIHAYCLMTDHYHLLVETPDGNLGKGMRELNGVYTHYFGTHYFGLHHSRIRETLINSRAARTGSTKTMSCRPAGTRIRN